MRSLLPGVKSIIDSPVETQSRREIIGIPRYWQWNLFTFGLVLVDTVTISFAFYVAYVLRFQSSIPFFLLWVEPSAPFYTRLTLVLIPVLLLIFAVKGLYQRQNLVSGIQEYDSLLTAVSLGMILVIAAGFLYPDFIFARGWLLSVWMLAFLFTAIGRFLMRRVVYALRDRGFLLAPAVIVGANDEGHSLAEQLIYSKYSGLRLVGFVEDDLPNGTRVFRHLQNLGGIDDLESIIRRYGVEEVILSSSALTREQVLGVFKQFGISDQVNLRLSSGLFETITTGLKVKELASVPLVEVNKVRLTGVDLALKTVVDYCISIALLPVIALVGLLIALAIKLDSPGPVIHRRRVVGVNGKEYDAFKFRTMHENGDRILEKYPELKQELAQNHKLKDDPRITRVGRLLRKTSLDELSQILNVLRNEMSLVGPRMITPEEVGKYGQWGINLLTVKPGITGLWQVSGRSDLTYDQRVRLDMYYIRNWSIWLDLRIILQTIPTVLSKRGAY